MDLQLWIILSACLTAACHATDKRCKNVISVPNHEACQLFGLITGDNDANDAIICTDGSLDKKQCSERDCCWFMNACYRKPVKCYADFRLERCPLRQGWTASSIYTGYSINGSNCFIEIIQSYLEVPGRFWNATSPHGIRILGPSQRNASCVKWVNTNVTVIPGAPKNCTVESWFREDRKELSRQNGTMRAQKCVLNTGRYFIPFDIKSPMACGCHLDSWAESDSENTLISNEIREYAEKEEAKSSCARILGRLVRKSWRDRVDIVNSAEVGIVVDALLNITTKKVGVIAVKDAEVLLETSKQLSKYKFYEGLENHSANLLIQLSTKFLSKIMKSVTTERRPTERIISKRSSEPAALMDSRESSTYQAPDDLQWKIMENLEGIAENIASLIDLSQEEFKYVVEAKEEVVSLQVAIAKPENINHLKNVTRLDQKENSTETGHAYVTDFSSYKGEDNVAIITVFYEVREKERNGSQRRASGILAINPRTMKNEVVSGRLSLPVTFTLPASNDSCNGISCESVCVYAVKRSATFGESWDDAGCWVIHADEDFTTCSCNHTTHFAVLMQPFTESVWSEEDVRVFEMLSVVLGSVSVAALSATLVVFIIYRRILLKDRMLIHLHLIFALMGGYISLLCGSLFSTKYLNVQEACFGFAIASHLFFLSAFFWFQMEGIYLFYKVVMVFSNKWGEWVTKYSPIIGWGAPTLIVIVSVAVSRNMEDNDGPGEYDPYYNATRCFLQTENGMIWAFMAPTLAIITINICVLIKVVIVIYQSSLSRNTKSSEHEKVSDSLKNSAKGAVLLMPILGVPWILNIFAIVGGSAGTAIAYLHVILMGLQGVFIFIFYCFFNSEVRAAYKLSAERRRSMATLESTTKNNRKRSRTHFVTSKEDSSDGIRYKNSLTVSSISRTPTGSSHTSTSSAPASPNSRKNSLPTIEEHRL